MTDATKTDDGSELVSEKVHAAAITRFLWGVASTLMGAWIIASLSFAFSVNSHCVEFRQTLTDLRTSHNHLAGELERLHDIIGDYPQSRELVGLRGDVSQLQYSNSVTVQTLNDLTRQIRDLHPWPVPSRDPAPRPPAQP